MSLRDEWKFIKASVPGTSHKLYGIPCQDSALVTLLYSNTDNDTVLVAVASDGAGSAVKSLDGSRMTCEVFTELIRDYFSNGGSLNEITRSLSESWLYQIKEKIACAANE
ncbi:MAG: protein phosphatase 2C domain-containing protein, partial [Nitrososphaera sp.]|nr:protein phosphatase 2C domain-containing protein [Nitrososphaera sp.]